MFFGRRSSFERCHPAPSRNVCIVLVFACWDTIEIEGPVSGSTAARLTFAKVCSTDVRPFCRSITGRVPRSAQTLASVPCWPNLASS